MGKKVAPKSSSKHGNKVGKPSKVNKKNIKKDQRKNIHGKRSKSRQETSSSSEPSDSEVQVSFDFFNMAERDFHAIKQFLGVSLGLTGHPVALSELAAFLTEDCADHIGSTCKSEGEESDAYAFISVLPVAFCQGKSFCSGLKEYFMKKAPESIKVQLKSVWDKTAIVFHERFINLPAGIAVPMLENLLGDWGHAEGEDAAFQADHVLYLTPTYKLVAEEVDREDDTETRLEADYATGEQVEYYYQEAEYLKEHSLAHYTFRIPSSHTTTDSRRAFTEQGVDAGRAVFLLTRRAFTQWVNQVKDKIVD